MGFDSSTRNAKPPPQDAQRRTREREPGDKEALQQIWKERGIEIGVRNELTASPGTHAAELRFLI
jgi:hypothetical protein